jgi:ATP adenylyltransferase
MTNSIYQQFLDFITDKRQMRMSHIYQPVMLMTLLQNQGRASVEQIANEFLIYYSQIPKAMPGRVLGKKSRSR